MLEQETDFLGKKMIEEVILRIVFVFVARITM
jgi:hypothetical protein